MNKVTMKVLDQQITGSNMLAEAHEKQVHATILIGTKKIK
jgi:hypothetical protein